MCHRFYRASFHADLLLVPQHDDDEPRFGRALPADSSAPLFRTGRVKNLLATTEHTPPRMMINVLLRFTGQQPVVAEIQARRERHARPRSLASIACSRMLHRAASPSVDQTPRRTRSQVL